MILRDTCVVFFGWRGETLLLLYSLEYRQKIVGHAHGISATTNNRVLSPHPIPGTFLYGFNVSRRSSFTSRPWLDPKTEHTSVDERWHASLATKSNPLISPDLVMQCPGRQHIRPLASSACGSSWCRHMPSLLPSKYYAASTCSWTSTGASLPMS